MSLEKGDVYSLKSLNQGMLEQEGNVDVFDFNSFYKKKLTDVVDVAILNSAGGKRPEE